MAFDSIYDRVKVVRCCLANRPMPRQMMPIVSVALANQSFLQKFRTMNGGIAENGFFRRSFGGRSYFISRAQMRQSV
ncbi:hypothetical protein RGR602_PB00427 (plasmid) [Rhizobium gallicum bv. gallicum R602sp]|uniref:Uncharacterized protein n=1 Tax=Rhizobium gallicum bv. gallicum R602sp TaxID=1041138 RepID=A0A0B4XBQ6_9HYPH|nr:hypothetical protein RGR602_PB00427 [Rhizobium gallicum bv. gallicum R602sp]